MEERKERTEELGIILLEPIMKIEVTIPKEYRGNIIADLSSRRASSIKNTEDEGIYCYIDAIVPLREVLNYSSILRQITQGRGTYLTSFFKYREVPKEVLKKILQEEN